MSDKKKFEDVDLEKLKELQDKFNNIVLQLGQVDIELIKNSQENERLNSVKESLHSDFLKLRQDEQTLADELTKKYGVGVLDPRTGEFTPQQNSDNKSN